MRALRFGLVLAALAILVAFASYALQKNEAIADEQMSVRWLISHQPTGVFDRAAETFASEIEAQTNGRMTIEVITPQDIGWTDGDIPNSEVERMLKSGEADIATLYTVPLGQKAPALYALNLPYLAPTYEAAETLLQSEKAAEIMKSLAGSDLRPLAFTMSGGLRIIAAKDFSVRTPQDLKGKRIATSGGPVAEETLRALGAIPVSTNLESGRLAIDDVDAVETTYSRLAAVAHANNSFTSYISETNHSIFLTMIVAGESFFERLSADDKQALATAASTAARVERADSAAFADTVKKELLKNGASIQENVPREALKQLTAGVYSTDAVPSETLELFAQ